MKKEACGGNGKRDRTPTPVGLRKIKRVSLEVFLRLKELVNSVKVNDSIAPRGYRKKSILKRKKFVIVAKDRSYGYEPSKAVNANSSLRQWHRVKEWHRYINDPMEKISGHMIT